MRTVKATLLQPNTSKKDENKIQNMIVHKYIVVKNFLLVLFNIIFNCRSNKHRGILPSVRSEFFHISTSHEANKFRCA